MKNRPERKIKEANEMLKKKCKLKYTYVTYEAIPIVDAMSSYMLK